MSLFKNLKELANKIINKFERYKGDIRKDTPERQRLIKEAIVEDGKKSFVQKIKAQFIRILYKEDVKKEIGRELELKDTFRMAADLNQLLLLINKEAHDYVKLNMGDGARKDILNYRTGRFARSVRAEAIDQDGEEISVHYTFMREIYGTFMPGGKQEFPRSRRPDHLIRKSIRQLAFEKANTSVKAILKGGARIGRDD